MGKISCAIHSLIIPIACLATNLSQSTDTISDALHLKEVVVTGENIQQSKDGYVILPTRNQKQHATSGYDVLSNVMFPGLEISSNGAITVNGLASAMYINGLQTDVSGVVNIRPKDIIKIEVVENPSGRFSSDLTAVNFIVKEFYYGGYATLDGSQKVGYTEGDYKAGAVVNRKGTTYSVYGGAQYRKNAMSQSGYEIYGIDQTDVRRSFSNAGSVKTDNTYGQLNISHRNSKLNLTGRATVVSNRMPRKLIAGTLLDGGSVISSLLNQNQSSLSPKIDVFGWAQLDSLDNLSFSLHYDYSRNIWNRSYEENGAAFNSFQRERANMFHPSVTYTRSLSRGSLMLNVEDYYNSFHNDYSGTSSSRQNLTRNEFLAFALLSWQTSQSFSFKARLGIDWSHFGLNGTDKINHVNPRANFVGNYSKGRYNMTGYLMLANPTYGANIINDAVVQLNPYMYQSGTRTLDKGTYILSYLRFSSYAKKAYYSFLVQYDYSHNALGTNYKPEDHAILKTYNNVRDNQTWYAQASLTYALSNPLRFGLNATYTNTLLGGPESERVSNLNLSIVGLWNFGRFALKGTFKTPATAFDMVERRRTKTPLSYNLRISYATGNIYAYAETDSPFAKRKDIYDISTVYYSNHEELRDYGTKSYAKAGISYSFDFGKRVERQDADIDMTHQSSIMNIN